MYRVIKEEDIFNKVSKLIEEVNFSLPKEIEEAFVEAKNREIEKNPQIVLDILIKNAEIAREKKLPICQDCGMVVSFVEIGKRVCIDGDLDRAINDAVREVYIRNNLRKSIVRDPLRRTNTGDNTPAIIHYEFVDGDRLKIYILIKGFGSENASLVKNLLPTISKEELIKEIVNHIRLVGSNACPPLIIGVGIGGTIEKAAYLAKKALLKPLNEKNKDPFWAEIEGELLNRINDLGIGPGGLGGRTTALSVHIETFPVHIAGLTLAINVQCCAVRHGCVEI